MEWQVILVLAIAVSIILFPVVFIWYLNIGGIYIAIREGRGLRTLETIRRVMRIAVRVIVPVGVYGFLIWFFLGQFGWQVALAAALALPIVFFVPVLVWGVVASGLYLVVRDRLRRRVMAPRRRVERMAEEPVIRETT